MAAAKFAAAHKHAEGKAEKESLLSAVAAAKAEAATGASAAAAAQRSAEGSAAAAAQADEMMTAAIAERAKLLALNEQAGGSLTTCTRPKWRSDETKRNETNSSIHAEGKSCSDLGSSACSKP
jgi:hypothetical protein